MNRFNMLFSTMVSRFTVASHLPAASALVSSQPESLIRSLGHFKVMFIEMAVVDRRIAEDESIY